MTTAPGDAAMQLIIFRHGIAEPHHPRGDAQRALTPRGIERTMLAARGLARLADRPQAILTSPKVRATQTAAILGDTFDLAPQIFDPLADESPAGLHAALRERPEDELLLVGHEPTLSSLIEFICFNGGCFGSVDLKKAGAAHVEATIRRDEPAMQPTLHWLLTPRALRAMAEPAPP
jgi:phosphohistidine phosphatase